MDRKEELIKYLKDNCPDKIPIITPLVNDVVFLERQLEDLKKYPFIKVHPNDISLQKTTPAGKQYKELSQTYLNTIKVLCSVAGKDTGEGESPLRAYLNSLKNE